METPTLTTSKQPRTNCLNKEEHAEMMEYLERNGNQPLERYLCHLIIEKKTQTFTKLYEANQDLI